VVRVSNEREFKCSAALRRDIVLIAREHIFNVVELEQARQLPHATSAQLRQLIELGRAIDYASVASMLAYASRGR